MAATKAFMERQPRLKRVLRATLIPPLRTYFRFVPIRPGKQLVWNRLASHLWWLESRARGRTLFDADLLVETRDITGRYIYYFGVWEPNLTHWIRSRLEPGDGFIDVGANAGYYTLLASRLVGEQGTVVSIEASPAIFALLERNLRANHVGNVRAVNVAVWSRTERLELFTRPEHPPGTTTVVGSWADQWSLDSGGTILAQPLSAILTADEVRRARIVKIDVEGAEWPVLQGMGSLLESSREDLEVVVEIAPQLLESSGSSADAVVDFFGRQGFHPYEIVNDYSAAAYIDGRRPVAPRRITEIPLGPDQTDVIFSRTDGRSL